MRKLLLATIVVACACKGKSGPKAHDPVKGPALYRVDVVDFAIQPLDDSDKPKGEPQKVAVTAQGELRCRVEVDPGSAPITTWISGSVDDSGHTRMTHERDTAVAKDVNSCAHQAIANTKLSVPPGEYKSTMTVTFSEPQPQ